jgi:molybdopterin biosynthesis enzyme
VNRGKRQLFLSARRTAAGVEPLTGNGSGDLIAAAAGDCLIDLAPESTVAAGTTVRTLAYIGTGRGAGGVLPPR